MSNDIDGGIRRLQQGLYDKNDQKVTFAAVELLQQFLTDFNRAADALEKLAALAQKAFDEDVPLK